MPGYYLNAEHISIWIEFISSFFPIFWPYLCIINQPIIQYSNGYVALCVWSFPSKCLVPMMGADFMHNKWISKLENSFRSHFSIIIVQQYELLENLNSNVVDVWYFHSKFKYKPWSILFMAQTHNVSKWNRIITMNIVSLDHDSRHFCSPITLLTHSPSPIFGTPSKSRLLFSNRLISIILKPFVIDHVSWWIPIQVSMSNSTFRLSVRRNFWYTHSKRNTYTICSNSFSINMNCGSSTFIPVFFFHRSKPSTMLAAIKLTRNKIINSVIFLMVKRKRDCLNDVTIFASFRSDAIPLLFNVQCSTVV